MSGGSERHEEEWRASGPKGREGGAATEKRFPRENERERERTRECEKEANDATMHGTV